MTYATGFVPVGTVRLWRLPQAGFVIRGGGRTVLVDPWLSDTLERETAGAGNGVERVSPPPCRADELPPADVVCCTHGHPDHLDVETLRVVAAASPDSHFVVPAPLADRLAAADVDAGRIVGAVVDEPQVVADVEVLALPARHELDADAPDGYTVGVDDAGRHLAVGYVLRLGGVTVFHSGDTIRIPGDAERLRREQVHLVILPVNGRDAEREARGLVGNLHPHEAAELAAEAGIPQLVPCHYDGVVGNTGDPAAVVAHVVRSSLPLTVHVVGPAGMVAAA